MTDEVNYYALSRAEQIAYRKAQRSGEANFRLGAHDRDPDVALTLYKAGYVQCSKCGQLSTYEYAPMLRHDRKHNTRLILAGMYLGAFLGASAIATGWAIGAWA